MLKLSDLNGVTSKTITVNLGDREVEIPFKHKVITAKLRTESGKLGVGELKKLHDAREKAEKEKTVTDYIPKNIAIQQLCGVMDSIEIEVSKGQMLDPTDYDQMAELPATITEALYEAIFDEVIPKKASSKDSTDSTSVEKEEALSQVG